MLFIATVVVFWTTDYCYNVLHAKHHEVLTVFVIVCVSAPILGFLVGGILADTLCGGYTAKHSITLSLAFSVLSLISTIPIRMAPGLYSFGITLWIVLFLSSSVFPSLQGVMISSLSHELKAAGNSISTILLNLLGCLPAPFIYGFIYEKTKHSDPKLAMSLMLWLPSIASVIFIGLAVIFRLKNWKEDVQGDKNQGQNI